MHGLTGPAVHPRPVALAPGAAAEHQITFFGRVVVIGISHPRRHQADAQAHLVVVGQTGGADEIGVGVAVGEIGRTGRPSRRRQVRRSASAAKASTRAISPGSSVPRAAAAAAGI